MAIPSALIAAIPAIAQGVTGVYQTVKGNQLEKQAGERPEYEIPEEVLQALEATRTRANQTRLPGQSAIESQIKASTASTAGRMSEAAGSSSELLGALAQAGLGEQQNMMNLGIKSAQLQDQRQAELIDFLKKMGSYRDKEFQANEMNPWQEAMAASSAMKGSGMQNIFAGVSDVAGIGLNQVTNDQIEKILGLLGGSNSQANTGGVDLGSDLGVEKDPSMTNNPFNTTLNSGNVTDVDAFKNEFTQLERFLNLSSFNQNNK